jgi:hypothetical protein
MSKSIWHTADEIPDFDKSYVELSRSLQGDLVYSTWGHPNYITPNTIKWCYMDDLLALETENKDLSDKNGKLETELDCTRKALDIAVEKAKALKELADIAGFSMFSAGCQDIIEQITALEQKEE